MSSNENPFKYSENPELNNIFDQLLKIKEKELRQGEKMAQFANVSSNGFEFKKLHNVNAPNLMLGYYTTPPRYSSKKDLELIKKEVLAVEKETLLEIDRIEALNKPLEEHNKLVIQMVHEIMSKLGIKQSYSTYEYKTSRSSRKTEIKRNAGYSSDLSRVVPKSNVQEVKTKLGYLVQDMKNYVENESKVRVMDLIEKNEADLNKVINEESALVEILNSIGYDLITYLKKSMSKGDRISLSKKEFVQEAMDSLLKSNKYLRLAHYLEKNRSDWNDGYNYAEIGLSSFTVESQIDKDIYEDISSYFGEGWDGDGRVFRDCKYNYSVLFSMVEDKSLVDKYHKLAPFVVD